MQYAVPQFIDVENKIIGPISVRQFIIMAVAAFLIFLFYKFADFSLFIFATVIILAVAAVLAFVKINGRPFHFFLLNVLQTVKAPYRRVWKKEFRLEGAMPAKLPRRDKKGVSVQINYVKIAQKKEKARSRLSDLSLMADTGGFFASNPK